MKKEFSTKWTGSKRPSKQRKYRAKASLHLRKKFVSVNLSKELRKKHEKRNVPVKLGDTVKILRGKFKGKSGKITHVFLKISKVTIDGIQATKQDGSKVAVKMQPSNLQITALSTEGNKRFGKERKIEKKTEKKEVKKQKSESSSFARPSVVERKQKSGDKTESKTKMEKKK